MPERTLHRIYTDSRTLWIKVPAAAALGGLISLVLAGCSASSSSSEKNDHQPVSPKSMIHLLESTLPDGKISQREAVSGTLSASVLFEKGSQRSEIKVILNRWSVPVPIQTSDCPDVAYAPFGKCVQKETSRGAKLILDQSPEDQERPLGAQIDIARLTYPDGRQVAVAQTGHKAKNDEFPITPKQLSNIATSVVWDRILNKIPRRPSADSGKRITARKITTTIKSLLPAGIEAGREGGDVGFGHIVVDDGRGESLIGVDVQQWKAGNADLEKMFRESKRLANGVRIRVVKRPSSRGGKGATELVVDTLDKNGFRVRVTELNARSYHLPASRTDDALNQQQLRQIALDEAWKHI
ncbi:hypothetical protein [Streptomyces sp. ok210]|uniref:hypothetical protein n=1 Tax=Streptomyces sp. ok210 TaxID=1761905 RepID=UPI0008F36A25|nr:hypothetical protein [Streptomyces sp. ok210]SFT31412.1 hypothetical protein SAMN04487982_11948 [Streptomyces sp. ok210]